jgi:hypothetical protein
MLKLKCLGLSSLERTIARQCARVRHLAEGDANTKYFHLLARGRKHRNCIVCIKDVDGNMCTMQDQMVAAIADHLTGVFGQPGPGTFTLDYERLGVTPVKAQVWFW